MQGIKPGDIVHAVRVAVTGKAVGFGLFETLRRPRPRALPGPHQTGPCNWRRLNAIRPRGGDSIRSLTNGPLQPEMDPVYPLRDWKSLSASNLASGESDFQSRSG